MSSDEKKRDIAQGDSRQIEFYHVWIEFTYRNEKKKKERGFGKFYHSSIKMAYVFPFL